MNLLIEKPNKSSQAAITYIIHLKQNHTINNKKAIRSLPTQFRQLEQTQPTLKQPGIDLWQNSLNSARELAAQPEFWRELKRKTISIPNYRNDLFNSHKNVTKTTIETFNNLPSGEVYIVFRYPSGKTICARMREPDPLDTFDLGSWMLILNGCK